MWSALPNRPAATHLRLERRQVGLRRGVLFLSLILGGLQGIGCAAQFESGQQPDRPRRRRAPSRSYPWRPAGRLACDALSVQDQPPHYNPTTTHLLLLVFAPANGNHRLAHALPPRPPSPSRNGVHYLQLAVLLLQIRHQLAQRGHLISAQARCALGAAAGSSG